MLKCQANPDPHQPRLHARPSRAPAQDYLRLAILAGPLRGRWWLAESRGKLLSVVAGRYEPEQTRLFQQHVRPGMTVLDVGANAGYYTLLSSLLVGPSGSAWGFEADPRNSRCLRRNAAINGFTNAHVAEVAVADRPGMARFDFARGSGTGRLDPAGGLQVRTIRLDDFCEEHGLAPAVIKIDVEGAEMPVLQGAEMVIASSRPVIFLSTHGPEIHAACLQWLETRGYRFTPITGTDARVTSEVLCTPRHEGLSLL